MELGVPRAGLIKTLLRCTLYAYVVFLGSEEWFAQFGIVYKLGILLVGLMLAGLAAGVWRIRTSSGGVALGLFAMLGIASTLWSVNEDRSLTYGLMLVEFLATTWATVLCLEDESDRRMLAWSVLAMSLFPTVGMLHDFVTGHPSWVLGYPVLPWKDYGTRVTFGTADPNYLAFRYALSVAAANFLAFNTRGAGKRMLLYGLALVMAGTSLLSGSRGGFLALVLALLVQLVMDARRGRGRALLVAGGIAASVAIMLPFLPEDVSSRYLSIHSEVRQGRMANRKDIYREVADAFQRDPVLGVGYMAFETASINRGGLGDAAHNDILQVITDLGLVGLISFLAILAVLFRAISRTPAPWDLYGLSIMVAFLVSGTTITTLPLKLPWILFGLILGHARKPESHV